MAIIERRLRASRSTAGGHGRSCRRSIPRRRRRDPRRGGRAAAAGGIPQQLGRQAREPAPDLPRRRPGAACDEPMAYMQDLGQTFGPKSIDLERMVAHAHLGRRGRLPGEHARPALGRRDVRRRRDLRVRPPVPRRSAAAGDGSQVRDLFTAARFTDFFRNRGRRRRRRVDARVRIARRPDRRSATVPVRPLRGVARRGTVVHGAF